MVTQARSQSRTSALSQQQPERDRSLRLIRRLDWRFLLPKPQLGRVVYFGSASGLLASALREYSQSLTVLSTKERSFPGHPSPSFDLAVVTTPQKSVLEQAHALLAEGGYLYCESDRRAQRSSSRYKVAFKLLKDGSSQDPAHSLSSLGFLEIRTYWHHPNFESCLRMIPLREPSALEHFLVRSGIPLPRTFARTLGRFAANTGLLIRFLPCVSVIARKAGDSLTAP